MKTLFFDLGNVIVHFEEKKIYEKTAYILGVDQAYLIEFLQKTSLNISLEKGTISEQKAYENILQIAKKKPSFSTFSEALCCTFSLNTGILPVLSNLKSAGHKLVLLSNTHEIHYAFIKKNYSVHKYFDQEILSYEEGVRKPDLEIFKIAVKKANCLTKDAFFIDDLQENIQTAKSFGIDSLVFTNVKDLKKFLHEKGLNLDYQCF